MKHLALFGSVGIALDRKDILLFATYSALGFVFLENIIYLSNIGETSGFGGAYFGTWFSRSIVSLLLHIFASLILALGFIQFTRRAGLSSVFAFAQ
jgi:RsiW-degrading membrane proteinase PrsW (M82 family)